MASKIKPFTTGNLTVQWAHLHEADTKFGDDAANHSCTVIVDVELQKELDALMKDNGVKKINGMRVDDDGNTLLKAKSKVFVKENVKSFPCRDAKAELTKAIAYGGDTVRLRLAPTVLTRDGSMSLFLNGVQIIEKKPYDGAASATGGFEVTDGFDGSTYEEPTASSETTTVTDENMDEIPF